MHPWQLDIFALSDFFPPLFLVVQFNGVYSFSHGLKYCKKKKKATIFIPLVKYIMREITWFDLRKHILVFLDLAEKLGFMVISDSLGLANECH